MDRPFRQRLADMLLIKSLLRSRALTRDQAAAAILQGKDPRRRMPQILLEQGWVSAERLDEALLELSVTMRDLA